MHQRDLFKADVAAFPLDRTVEVERMARFLYVVLSQFPQSERAQRYYTHRCREFAKRMLAVGLAPEEVQRQILAFQEAVQLRLAAHGQRRAGIGA